jgi:hypothetical protein
MQIKKTFFSYNLIITLEQFVSLFLERGEPTIIVLESLLFLHLAVVLDVASRILPEPLLLLMLVGRCLTECDIHARCGLA